jgi:hypothetical protein
MLIKLFVVSLVAACALMMALAGSALGGTDSNFPDGIPVNPQAGVTACTTLAGTAAVSTGSDTGLANKGDLFTDACLGGP